MLRRLSTQWRSAFGAAVGGGAAVVAATGTKSLPPPSATQRPPAKDQEPGGGEDRRQRGQVPPGEREVVKAPELGADVGGVERLRVAVKVMDAGDDPVAI